MKKILLAILIVMPATARAVTFEDIINQVRTGINDTGPSDSYRYSEADMIRTLNFVHSEVCAEARIPETSYSTTTSPSQSEYNLPTDISGVPTRVAYYIRSSTSNFERMGYQDIGALDADNANWESMTPGLPKYYYLRADKIGLKPAPSATYSTTTWNTLKIYYVEKPVDATSATLSSSPFSAYPQYQSYSNIIVAGVEAYLTGRGYELYYSMLANISENVKENYDRFISREPDRRRY